MNQALLIQKMEGLPGITAPKLHGRAFYESIGSPKLIIAPMVDRSEFVGICAVAFPQPTLTITIGLARAHAIVP